MSQSADTPSPAVPTTLQGWLIFSMLIGVAAGALATALTFLSPVVVLVFLLWKIAGAL